MFILPAAKIQVLLGSRVRIPLKTWIYRLLCLLCVV